ncbi:MAG: archaeoflavoprotein AfpA [Candidatus Hodarchaeota archaeon]
MKENTDKKKKVAWGISGSGDLLTEIVNTIIEINREYESIAEIRPYLSKAADKVVKMYKLGKILRENFDKVSVEIDSNSPFLAGQLQLGKFEFLLIAPATSTTVAKISLGIGDTLLTNSAIMALKTFVPVYIKPSDYIEGIMVTKLPKGKNLKIRVRKEDVEHVDRLRKMNGAYILEKPEEIREIFRKHFGR